MTQKTEVSAFHYTHVHAVHAVHDINRLRMHAAEKGTNKVQKRYKVKKKGHPSFIGYIHLHKYFYTPGFKSPKQLEALSMPSNDSFGFGDDQWFLPVFPEMAKHDPEKMVFCTDLRSFLLTFPDGQLLAERYIFQSQIAILLGSDKYVQNQFQQRLHHGCKLCRPVLKCQ